uniref:Uncharacterized protein n=1 Tax=Trichogramma kaykai TaxID=54128 RepID=A0ABD2X495_9HYME
MSFDNGTISGWTVVFSGKINDAESQVQRRFREPVDLDPTHDRSILAQRIDFNETRLNEATGLGVQRDVTLVLLRAISREIYLHPTQKTFLSRLLDGPATHSRQRCNASIATTPTRRRASRAWPAPLIALISTDKIVVERSELNARILYIMHCVYYIHVLQI